MPWSWTSTAKAAGKDKGKGKGGGGNGSQTAAGSGVAAAGESATDRKYKQLQKRMEKEAKEFAAFKKETAAKLRAAELCKGSAAKKPKEFWTCNACGDERCFSTRDTCHKCGTGKSQAAGQAAAKAAPPKAAAAKAARPKAPAAAAPETPPGLQEAADSMETEAVPVEEQISKLEAEIKLYRNATFPQSKALVASFEAEVKVLKEQQKLARPLPARFQAATDKLVKFKLQKEELAVKAQFLQEQAEAAAKAFQE